MYLAKVWLNLEILWLESVSQIVEFRYFHKYRLSLQNLEKTEQFWPIIRRRFCLRLCTSLLFWSLRQCCWGSKCTVSFFLLDRYWNCFFGASGTARVTKNRYLKSRFLIFLEFPIKKIQNFSSQNSSSISKKIKKISFKISIKISKILHPMHLILSN